MWARDGVAPDRASQRLGMSEARRLDGRRERRFLIGVTIAAAACGAIDGYVRDFGFFLFELFAVPSLFAICLAIAAVAFFAYPRLRRRVGYALLLVATIVPLADYVVRSNREEIHFAAWAPTHLGLLSRFSLRDGVIVDWGGWGIAGLENEEYLVAVHGPPFATASEATRWANTHGGACEIVWFERLAPSIFVLMTSNCAF